MSQTRYLSGLADDALQSSIGSGYRAVPYSKTKEGFTVAQAVQNAVIVKNTSALGGPPPYWVWVVPSRFVDMTKDAGKAPDNPWRVPGAFYV